MNTKKSLDILLVALLLTIMMSVSSNEKLNRNSVNLQSAIAVEQNSIANNTSLLPRAGVSASFIPVLTAEAAEKVALDIPIVTLDSPAASAAGVFACSEEGVKEETTEEAELVSVDSVCVTAGVSTAIKEKEENYVEPAETPEPEPELSEYEKAVIHNNEVFASGQGEFIVLDRTFTTITWDEFDLLCHIIMAEAEGEIDDAQEAVGEVVLNRVDSQYFAQTNIHDVIYAPKQFSPVKDGRINLEPHEAAKQNALRCLVEHNLPHNALYFTSYTYFKWEGCRPYGIIDDTWITLYKD